MGRFLTGIVVGIVLTLGAQKYHVLRTSQGVELVPKLVTGFGETYLDVRDYTPDDWAQHKQVVAAVVHAGKEHILGESASRSLLDGMDGVLENLGLRSGTADGEARRRDAREREAEDDRFGTRYEDSRYRESATRRRY